VNNIPGGNSTLGTIDSSGVYTAPSAVPTPYTVTVTATSAADPTKSASSPLIVAGTILTTSQFVSAASGATITLVDGSSVTIEPGLLPSDVNVTLTEVSYLPDQPPNPAIELVGPGLVLTFDTPLQFLARSGSEARIADETRIVPRPNFDPTKAISAVINVGVNWSQDIVGSAVVTDLKGTAANLQNAFIGASGVVDSAAMTVTGTVSAVYLNVGTTVDGIAVSAANIVGSVANATLKVVTPNRWGLASPANWTTTLPCSSGKVIMLVHGMNSQLSTAFPPLIAQLIKQEGQYDQVYGFDYDWLQHINGSGTELAAFLDAIAATCHPGSIDVEAHSEGVAVTMSALTQVDPRSTLPSIKRFFALDGPIMGTPVANDPNLLLAYYSEDSWLWLPYLAPTTLAEISIAPFVTDLTVSTPGTGDYLDTLRQKIAAMSANNAPQIFVVGGDVPGSQLMYTAAFLNAKGVIYSDGFIPLASELAFQPGVGVGKGLKVYPFPPFPLNHVQVTTDPSVISSTTSQVTNAFYSPSLTLASIPGCADPLVCAGPPGTDFSVSGAGFSYSMPNASYEQFASGQVVTLSPFTTNSGTISQVSWQDMATTCSTPQQTVVFFANNSTQPSNAVTEEVVVGNCVASGSPPTVSVSVSPNPPQAIQEGATQTFTATVSGGGGVTWSASGGTITSSGTYTALYTAPNTTGTFQVAATSTLDSSKTATAVVTVVAAASSAPSITTNALNPATATVGTSYTAQAVAATGGTTPYTWSVSGQPSSITMNPSTGILSGTPTAYGTFSLNVTVRDSSSPQKSASQVLSLVVNTQQAAQAPSASTGAASAITTNSATLGGTVNPNGADTHFNFEYGTSSSLSSYSSTGTQDLGSGTSASGISANVASLNAGTQYYFRVVAYNSSGTTNGLIVPFSTASAAQTGPTAHFTMTGQSQTVSDPSTLSLTVITGGSVSVNLSSTSTQGSAAITSYAWNSNGPQCTNSPTCGITITGSGNAIIALTVTDSNAKQSTATGYAFLTVVNPTPAISSVSPNPLPALSGLQQITIKGTNFPATTSDGYLLFTDPIGKTYPSTNYPTRVLSTSTTQWVYNIDDNGTNGAGPWKVQMINNGQPPSVAYPFTVK
jgi:hypothetical protein